MTGSERRGRRRGRTRKRRGGEGEGGGEGGRRKGGDAEDTEDTIVCPHELRARYSQLVLRRWPPNSGCAGMDCSYSTGITNTSVRWPLAGAMKPLELLEAIEATQPRKRAMDARCLAGRARPGPGVGALRMEYRIWMISAGYTHAPSSVEPPSDNRFTCSHTRACDSIDTHRLTGSPTLPIEEEQCECPHPHAHGSWFMDPDAETLFLSSLAFIQLSPRYAS